MKVIIFLIISAILASALFFLPTQDKNLQSISMTQYDEIVFNHYFSMEKLKKDKSAVYTIDKSNVIHLSFIEEYDQIVVRVSGVDLMGHFSASGTMSCESISDGDVMLEMCRNKH